LNTFSPLQKQIYAKKDFILIEFVYLLVSKYFAPVTKRTNTIQTRDEIIRLADSLIRTKGFNAFSYADIGGVMDVRNATIHYHFPTKSDLGISVMREEALQMTRDKNEWDQLSGEAQLKRIVETFFRKSRKRMICLTGALTPEYDTFTWNMQAATRNMCEAILDQMSECLEKGRREGQLYFPGDATDRALLVMSCLLSSLLLSRVLGEEIFDRMIDQQLKDLGSNIRVSQFQEEIPEHLL
jgi:AcrR family transcriptional regulator